MTNNMNTAPTITPLEHKRKQLTFRSWHRGTKEMDLLMGTFADTYLPTFTAAELNEYENVLKENDPNLYSWIMGTRQPPEDIVTPTLLRVLKHRFSS